MDVETEDRIVAKVTNKIFVMVCGFALAGGLWRFYGIRGVILGFGALWAGKWVLDVLFAPPNKPTTIIDVKKSGLGPGIIPAREEAREKRNKRRLEDKLKLGQ